MAQPQHKRVLSGIQTSGMLHIGNYFGAIKQFLELQDKGHELFVFAANYHALTSIQDRAVLESNTLHIVRAYLALGLDPARTNLFLQSHVPEVCELSWFLSVVTPMGLLERCHSYKDKLAKGIAPNHGLFSYPMLMAADILAYDSNIVPVGKDQKQHVEVTRDVAVKFNTAAGKDVLVVPEEYIVESTAVVPGIDGQKMSKSYGNTIEIFMPEKQLKKRVMAVVTDSTPMDAPKDPEKCNVFALLKLFCPEEEQVDWRKKYLAGGMGYGEAKGALLDKILQTFGPARVRYEELCRDDAYVTKVLKDGSERARAVAQATLKRVRESMGII